ncbi:helix-turn-helix domain-containing protein [Chryseobacterium lathyri]|uniref:Excisionase family DNA binding protein n=1 Tax=Chryseobacterium lathyri TaxID=395933 RepID=A0ABT9SM82_9FLAO|nr:helix-turn-helix domain-containing protein [Chryseobacterium lathyri]MDP9960546.1 excisionase family DNA binding protein [Chryseobacterium lathyri]MDQ0067208.1 excisionase family DNA binding protein [Chryseobacterium lathyri]
MSSNIKIKKICQHCGQEFIARTTVTKYCGDNCAKKAYKVKVREEKIKSSEKQLTIQKESIKSKPDPNSYFALKTLDYLTVKEAAVLLKCDCRTIYFMVKSKRLPAINLSQRKTRILKKDIDALFETSHTIKTPIQEVTIHKSIEETPLKDCFTIGQIQSEYNLSETSLQSLIRRHEIPKFQKGKFVYVPKSLIQPILNKIQSHQYCG